MAYKIRVATRKEELKKPDEFIGTMDWLGEKIREQSNLLLTLLGIALLIGIGLGAYRYYQYQQENRAAALEFEASLYYHQQTPLSAMGSALSKEDKYKKAIELYRKILQDYPAAASASIAQYYIGNAYLDLGEFESAVTAYRAYLDRTPKNEALAGLAYQRLGYAYRAQNNLEGAVQVFESVDRLPGALNKDQSRYELGRLNEALGKTAEAIRVYQEIAARFPDSLFLAEAQKRLTALGVVEVKPAESSAEETPKTAPVGGEAGRVDAPKPAEKK